MEEQKMCNRAGAKEEWSCERSWKPWRSLICKQDQYFMVIREEVQI